MRYLMNITYDGSKFYGYQIQKNKITIEGELEKIVSMIFNENINIIGTSRTDKGVHAINQYCHFDSDKKINIDRLKHSINSLINDSIYIKNIAIVDDLFHSRYNCIKKEYIYKINMNDYDPISKDYIYQYNKKIARELLDKFISKVSGKHNYKSFTSDKDKKSYEKIVKIDYKISKGILYLRFESSGFLRYMIRNIVGLLLDINDGKKSINDIDDIFKSENRVSLGVCASPVGLYLNKIYFKKQ